jgi:hypothetical protein
MSFFIDDERPKRLVSGPRMISTALLTGKPEVLVTKGSKKLKSTPGSVLVSTLSKRDQAKKDSKTAISSAIDALLDTKPSKKVVREYFKERVKTLCA